MTAEEVDAIVKAFGEAIRSSPVVVKSESFAAQFKELMKTGRTPAKAEGGASPNVAAAPRSCAHPPDQSDERGCKVCRGEFSGKYDTGKVRMDLVPPHALEELARIYTHGAIKYQANNYLDRPFEWSRVVGALMRHVEEWRKGSAIDRDSGLKHLAHAAWGCMTLLEYERLGIGKDDRWKAPVGRDVTVHGEPMTVLPLATYAPDGTMKPSAAFSGQIDGVLVRRVCIVCGARPAPHVLSGGDGEDPDEETRLCDPCQAWKTSRMLQGTDAKAKGDGK